MDAIFIITMVVVSGFSVGLIVSGRTEERWRRETVKLGLAIYDPITGEWRWKEPTDKGSS